MAAFLALCVSACIPQPMDRRAPARPPALPNDSAAHRQCLADLTALGARYRVLPDYRNAAGCSALNAVEMSAAGASITNLRATQCPVARALARWVQGPVQSAARALYGQRVVRVETMGSYACRTVRGTANAGLSEHAFANAIDVSGFVLADGRRISVKEGWATQGSDAAFLRRVRGAACRAFRTVLSPDYNAAHQNHFHLDMARRPYCR
ncbi:MAG: extensin family protein [Chakrabartia sp.]